LSRNTSERVEGPPSFRTYVDAFLDLHGLVDEIRFKTGLAFLLIDDDARKPRDEEEKESRSRLPYLHDEVVAVALRYARQAPSPVTLFRDPHTRMSGGPVVGTWFAGQLVDSAPCWFSYRRVELADSSRRRSASRARCSAHEDRGAPHRQGPVCVS
jgi:hypothetical protein